MKSVELVNWTGQAFIGRRNHFAQIKLRKELHEAAVYLLISNSDESEVSRIYVGETDSFADRVTDHMNKKDWWSDFVVFVSKDRNLTKAHVRYLERQIYLLAKSAPGTIVLENSSEPSGSTLPEPDEAAMQEFLENMTFVLETLGLSYFPAISGDQLKERDSSEDASVAPRAWSDPGNTTGMKFYITLPKEAGLENNQPLRALMEVTNSAFILKAGSYLRTEPRPSFAEANGPTRSSFLKWQRIVNSNLVEKTDYPSAVRLIQDIEFQSPSAAGAVVRAGATNGRTDWLRSADDKPLNECEVEETRAA